MKKYRLSFFFLLSAFFVTGCNPATLSSSEPVVPDTSSSETASEEESQDTSPEEEEVNNDKYFHYPAVEPTCTKAGNYECWMNSKTKVFTLTKPDSTNIKEGSSILPTNDPSKIYYRAGGHDLVFDGYTWNTEETEATADYHCKRQDCDYVEHNEATVVDDSIPASCYAKGAHSHTASYKNETPETKAHDIEMVSHKMEFVEFIWTQDGTNITAQAKLACSFGCHTEETVGATITSTQVVQEATCYQKEVTRCVATYGDHEEAGEFVTHDFTDHQHVDHEVEVDSNCTIVGHTEYWYCNDCHRYYSDEELTNEITIEDTVINIKPNEHSWGDPQYEQSDDKLTVSAYRVCNHDASHIQEDVGVATFDHYITEPTDLQAGEAEYRYVFTNPLVFSHDPVTLPVPPLGHEHSYGEPTYTWSEDNSKCTAKMVCLSYPDCTDAVIETVDTTSEVSLAAKCEEKGKTTYTATFTNASFAKQTKEVENINPIGHSYEGGIPSYTWTQDGDNYYVTASIHCQRTGCNHELKEENVLATLVSTDDPTCLEDGVKHYSVSFTNDVFSDQNKDEIVPTEGHHWATPTYIWNDDKTVCTARRECTNCDEYEQEVGTITLVTTTEPKCGVAGEGYNKATFTDPAFSEAHSDPFALDALEHDWSNVTYTWSENKDTCTAHRECLREGCNAEQNEEKASELVTLVESTCGKYGSGYYTVTFDNPAFGTQNTNVLQLSKKDHDYVDVYKWATGSKTVSSETICTSGDPTHTTNQVADAHTAQNDKSNDSVTSFSASTSKTSELINDVTHVQRSGDINIHFSNAPSGTKGTRYYFETKLRITHGDELTDAKDLMLIKLDNSYYYGTWTWENSTEDSYAIFYSDLSSLSDGKSDRFNNNVAGTDSFKNELNGETMYDEFLEFTKDCYLTITADLDVATRKVTIVMEYESLVSGYSGQKYTQTFEAIYSSKDFTDRNGVNSIRIARPKATTTMSLQSFVCSTNIDRNVFFDSNGSKGTIISYPNVNNAKY